MQNFKIQTTIPSPNHCNGISGNFRYKFIY
uniref:Uncharacterized protein n=1 Tax=Arundo donax TaxID=35708 RepID=A0A0A9ELR7_ARUDO